MIERMVKIIKEIDISKYTQKEYAEIVDEIYLQFKAKALDNFINDLLDSKGWQDTGVSG
jgi:hypothetical protein